MKIMYYTGRALIRMLGKAFFGLTITGVEHIPPQGGLIVACNHITHYDPPVVGSCLNREAYFLAKKELFENPLFGWVLTQVNSLPVRRGTIDRNALNLMLEKIEAGNAVMMFPEGTRSRTGQFLEPKSGIGLMAHRAKCPILPAYIENADQIGQCFKRKKKLLVRFGEPISAEWVASHEADKAAYGLIARTVMERIAEIRQTLRPKDSPPLSDA